MVNKVKYQIEVELSLDGLDENVIKNAGLSLAEGINAGVDQSIDVDIKNIQASVYYTVDCTPPEDLAAL